VSYLFISSSSSKRSCAYALAEERTGEEVARLRAKECGRGESTAKHGANTSLAVNHLFVMLDLHHGQRSEKKWWGGTKGSEGETRIRVEGEVLLGANPRKSCNRFLNNYKA